MGPNFQVRGGLSAGQAHAANGVFGGSSAGQAHAANGVCGGLSAGQAQATYQVFEAPQTIMPTCPCYFAQTEFTSRDNADSTDAANPCFRWPAYLVLFTINFTFSHQSPSLP